MSIILKLEMPEGAFSALREDPEGLARELRLTAASKWYEMGMISQEKAAEIAGLSRADFIFALAKYGKSILSCLRLTYYLFKETGKRFEICFHLRHY